MITKQVLIAIFILTFGLIVGLGTTGKPTFSDNVLVSKEIGRDIINEIKNHLNEQNKNDSLHGVVLIGKDSEIFLEEAYGYVSLDSLQKHTLENELGMASMGKMFTAISIMKLVSEKRIDLNDLIGKYLFDIENKTVRDSIRIKHLLSHTSGLDNYWEELGEDEKSDDLSYVYSLVKNDSVIRPVGEKFNYSNSGYIILGKIIEKVTGMSYADYIGTNILNPCLMTNTVVSMPDGGGKTTANDLWKFAMALKKNRIIDARLLGMMTESKSKNNYGYGFMTNYRNGHKVYGHTGGYFQRGTKIGIASALDIIDNGYTVIILTNRNPREGGAAARNYMLDIISSLDSDD